MYASHSFDPYVQQAIRNFWTQGTPSQERFDAIRFGNAQDELLPSDTLQTKLFAQDARGDTYGHGLALEVAQGMSADRILGQYIDLIPYVAGSPVNSELLAQFINMKNAAGQSVPYILQQHAPAFYAQYQQALQVLVDEGRLEQSWVEQQLAQATVAPEVRKSDALSRALQDLESMLKNKRSDGSEFTALDMTQWMNGPQFERAAEVVIRSGDRDALNRYFNVLSAFKKRGVLDESIITHKLAVERRFERDFADPFEVRPADTFEDGEEERFVAEHGLPLKGMTFVWAIHNFYGALGWLDYVVHEDLVDEVDFEQLSERRRYKVEFLNGIDDEPDLQKRKQLYEKAMAQPDSDGRNLLGDIMWHVREGIATSLERGALKEARTRYERLVQAMHSQQREAYLTNYLTGLSEQLSGDGDHSALFNSLVNPGEPCKDFTRFARDIVEFGSPELFQQYLNLLDLMKDRGMTDEQVDTHRELVQNGFNGKTHKNYTNELGHKIRNLPYAWAVKKYQGDAGLLALFNSSVARPRDSQSLGRSKTCKNTLLACIDNMPENDARLELYRQALDKNHPLGKVFWEARRGKDPSIKRGRLKRINSHYIRLLRKLHPDSDTLAAGVPVRTVEQVRELQEAIQRAAEAEAVAHEAQMDEQDADPELGERASGEAVEAKAAAETAPTPAEPQHREEGAPAAKKPSRWKSVAAMFHRKRRGGSASQEVEMRDVKDEGRRPGGGGSDSPR